jgi:hypothetical protein
VIAGAGAGGDDGGGGGGVPVWLRFVECMDLGNVLWVDGKKAEKCASETLSKVNWAYTCMCTYIH